MDAGENEIRMEKPATALRRGWTTGACATAATKSALTALLTGEFPDPVRSPCPRANIPSFPLAREKTGDGWAMAGLVKDAGDDPDVTHGALVMARVRRLPEACGHRLQGGRWRRHRHQGRPSDRGRRTGDQPGPAPDDDEVVDRALREPTASHPTSRSRFPSRTAPNWRSRPGTRGSASSAAFPCSAPPASSIPSPARPGSTRSTAASMSPAPRGLPHVLGATGSTSEKTAQEFYTLPDIACLDMGDFAGGLLKYLRAHPVPRLTIAGGFAKLTKLAQGALDLHSGRSQVSMNWLAERAAEAWRGCHN
jgi:cobalt-precorrin-5B (C1)-methyltransferase